MLKNYLISAIRSLKRYKLFTVLNVFGLSTGMACSILILLWVQDERSYDKFNENASSIYRLICNVSSVQAAVSPPPLVPTLKQQVPEITAVTRVVPLSATITIGGQKFDEKNILYADSNFLQLFNYPLLFGNKATVLSRPDGIVISAATAIKYFGNENTVGKVILVDDGYNLKNYIVTGVLQNLPHNSHLQFNMLVPISYYEISNGAVWDNYDVYSYIQLNSKFKVTHNSIQTLEKQINEIYSKNDKNITKSTFTLQPLTDIHLHSQFLLDVDGQGNIQSVNIFSLVSIFILLIACINFMNLSTAIGGQRAKEVGLRKTIGALRFQLITQFISESLLISSLSLVIGIVIAYLLLPFFNELASKAISFNLLNIKMVGGLLSLAVVVGLISGSYPAFFISSFKPVKVLKGLRITNGRKPFLRNGLVILQFAISVILMVSTLVVNNQLNFIRNRDMGFDKENLLYIQVPQTGIQQTNYEKLKIALQQNAGLTNYTIIDHLPTYLTTGTTDVIWPGKDAHLQTVFPHIGADANFIKTFGMHLLTGRTFDDHSKADQDNYILNETAVKVMGKTDSDIIGQKISSNGHPGTVIGVVRDFNFKPVQQPIEPLIIRYNNRANFLVLRISPKNIQPLIEKLKSFFQQLYPDYPYTYGFVDQDLSKLYVSEQRTAKLFNIFSVISIIISCLGIFGLATFATERRLKELGVRRVLGATVSGIVVMLAKDFIGLVSFSLLIAFPLAWWAMNKWLDNYVYRIEISWWMFVLAGVLSIVIAFLTISYQSLKAALINPVKSLRTE